MENKIRYAEDVIITFRFEASTSADGGIVTSQSRTQRAKARQYQVRFLATVAKVDEFYLFLDCPSLKRNIERLKGHKVEISYNYGYKTFYFNATILGRYKGLLTVNAPQQVLNRDRWDNYLMVINYQSN